MFSQLQKAIRERCRSTNNVHKRRRIDLGDLSQTKSDTTKSLCNVLCDIEGVPLLKQPLPTTTTRRARQKKSSPAKKQEAGVDEKSKPSKYFQLHVCHYSDSTGQ